ncbi:MAG: hypothetical protein ABSE63_05685, partial [Thermoguttaceae bacterium]
MSQIKLNFVVRPQFVCFLLTAAIILATVLPAGAVTTWDAGGSGTNLYWSNTNNWNPDGALPTGSPFADVFFAGTYASPNYTGGTMGSASSVTNEVTTNPTINSLTYNQVDLNSSHPGVVYHNTEIDPGRTLKISGSYSAYPVNYGISGNYSMYVGTEVTASDLTTKTYFTGPSGLGSGGTLDISTSSGGNTGGDIVVRELSTNNDTHLALLDLTGLSTFNANVDQLLIGYSSVQNTGNSTKQKATGSLYLARNNTITLNSTLNSPSQALISGAGLVIGFDPGNGNASGNNIVGSSSLYLGQTNIINVNNFWVGSPKSGGSLSFNPAFSGSTLYMRGVNPSGGDNTFTPVNYISIGDGSGGGSNACVGVVDLTGGSVDILATQIIVGRDGTAACSNARPMNGTLNFIGDISTSTMSIGQHSNNNAAYFCTGTVNVGNGSHLIVNGEMQMASFAGGTIGSATANLNVSGGLLTLGGNIDKGVTAPGTPVNIAGPGATPTSGSSTANINLTGGILDMGGHDIGYINMAAPNPATTAVPIDNFTIHGGALNNVGNLVVTNFIAAGNVSPLTGTVAIANGGKIDLRDGTAQNISAANLTLLGTSTLDFELGTDNSTSHSDYINLNGGIFNIGGNLTINVSRLGGSFAAAPNNTYTLISYGSETNSGSFSFTNTTRSTMNLVLGATALTLQVTNAPGHDLTWNGGTAGTWDVKTTANWTSLQAPSPDGYYDTDNVTFGPQASTVITLSNTISSNGFLPGSVIVNSANDYTFNATASTDKISGNTGLTKNGVGTLYMNLANDYLGTTTLNAGKTVLGNATALGSASAPLIIG